MTMLIGLALALLILAVVVVFILSWVVLIDAADREFYNCGRNINESDHV